MINYRGTMRCTVMTLACLAALAFGQDGKWDARMQAGNDAFARKQYAEAERAFGEAVKIAERFKENDTRITVGLIRLAEAMNLQSKREEAQNTARRAVVALYKARATEPKEVAEQLRRTEVSADILERAAAVFEANQNYTEAESTYQKLIAIREDAARSSGSYGTDDYKKFVGQVLTRARGRVADAYDKLAGLYFSQRRYQEVEPLYQKSIQLREAEFGADSPPAGASLSHLATLYAATGKYDKAEPLFARAIRIFERLNWLNNLEAATTFENYALLLKKTGRETEAAANLAKAGAIRARLP